MNSLIRGAVCRSVLVSLVGSAALFCGTAVAADTDPKASGRDAQQKELADARDRLESAAREVAKLSQQLAGNDRDSLMFLGRSPNRAMLGIGIGERDGKSSDEGVDVLSVSPDGAADKAGLKVDDVIVELNGKSLKKDKDGEPRQKLLDIMAKLSPGDDVTVNYRREGKPAVVKFKAEGLRRFAMSVPAARGFDAIPPMPPLPDLPDFRRFEGFDVVVGRRAGVFGDVELVPLTPKLGQYFGTETGLLVVRSPEKDSKLEDGDVLIDIDGRVPNNAGHAFRILGSYQPGEKVTFNIVRQKKKQAISLVVPEPDKQDRPARQTRSKNMERPIRVPLRTAPIV
jgi:C-terminal processing protease CtpA/Prc